MATSDSQSSDLNKAVAVIDMTDLPAVSFAQASDSIETSILEQNCSGQLTTATTDNDQSRLVRDVTNSSETLNVGRNETKRVVSGELDFDYGSQSSTPNSLKSTFINGAVSNRINLIPQSFWKLKQLRPYNKPISQLTWDRFSNLRELYAESLNNFTRSLPNCPSILMTLQVMGENEETAQPWVYVQCDRAVSKRVINFFKQPLIKVGLQPPEPDDRSPALKVLVHPLKPRLLAEDAGPLSLYDHFASSDLIEVFGDRAGLSTGTFCGTQIMNDHLSRRRKATIGGIILVTDKKGERKLFGMTSGHFFLPESHDESADELGDNLDNEYSDKVSYGLYKDEEESFKLNLNPIETKNEVGGESLFAVKAEDKPSEKKEFNELLKAGKLSEASHTSIQDGRNLDWALITIDRDFFILPNLLPYVFHIDLNQFGKRRPNESERDVIMVSVRGLERGTLSSSWSYMMLPPGKILVRTYLLSFLDGKTSHAGDSGCWIVDSVTNEVYGHIVASDIFGRGYVVPIHDSIKDIKNRTSAKLISLPSREDITAFNNRCSQLEEESSPNYQTNPIMDQSGDLNSEEEYGLEKPSLIHETRPNSIHTTVEVPDSGYSSLENSPIFVKNMLMPIAKSNDPELKPTNTHCCSLPQTRARKLITLGSVVIYTVIYWLYHCALSISSFLWLNRIAKQALIIWFHPRLWLEILIFRNLRRAAEWVFFLGVIICASILEYFSTAQMTPRRRERVGGMMAPKKDGYRGQDGSKKGKDREMRFKVVLPLVEGVSVRERKDLSTKL